MHVKVHSYSRPSLAASCLRVAEGGLYQPGGRCLWMRRSKSLAPRQSLFGTPGRLTYAAPFSPASPASIGRNGRLRAAQPASHALAGRTRYESTLGATRTPALDPLSARRGMAGSLPQSRSASHRNAAAIRVSRKSRRAADAGSGQSHQRPWCGAASRQLISPLHGRITPSRPRTRRGTCW